MSNENARPDEDEYIGIDKVCEIRATEMIGVFDGLGSFTEREIARRAAKLMGTSYREGYRAANKKAEARIAKLREGLGHIVKHQETLTNRPEFTMAYTIAKKFLEDDHE